MNPQLEPCVNLARTSFPTSHLTQLQQHTPPDEIPPTQRGRPCPVAMFKFIPDNVGGLGTKRKIAQKPCEACKKRHVRATSECFLRIFLFPFFFCSLTDVYRNAVRTRIDLRQIQTAARTLRQPRSSSPAVPQAAAPRSTRRFRGGHALPRKPSLLRHQPQLPYQYPHQYQRQHHPRHQNLRLHLYLCK